MNVRIAIVSAHELVATQVRELEKIIAKKQVSEFRTNKNSVEDVLRPEGAVYVKTNPAFAKQTTKRIKAGTTSWIVTESKIETLRVETEVLSRQIEQVISRMTATSLLVVFLHNTFATLSAAVGFNLSM